MTSRVEIVTTPERSRLMASVRQSGTSAELLTRRLLQELGIKYQTGARDLPGSPDLVGHGRNVYDPKMMQELGFTYSGVGRGNFGNPPNGG